MVGVYKEYTGVLAIRFQSIVADNFWNNASELLWSRLSSDKLEALVEPVANLSLGPLSKMKILGIPLSMGLLAIQS